MSLLGMFSKKSKTNPKNIKLLPEENRNTKKLTAQEKQIALIHAAEHRFEIDQDINALISFWEDVWERGGLLFNGSKWTFRLPDLYIKQKRYEDALFVLSKIKNPTYQDKKNSYIEKVNAAKKKASKK